MTPYDFAWDRARFLIASLVHLKDGFGRKIEALIKIPIKSLPETCVNITEIICGESLSEGDLQYLKGKVATFCNLVNDATGGLGKNESDTIPLTVCESEDSRRFVWRPSEDGEPDPNIPDWLRFRNRERRTECIPREVLYNETIEGHTAEYESVRNILGLNKDIGHYADKLENKPKDMNYVSDFIVSAWASLAILTMDKFKAEVDSETERCNGYSAIVCCDDGESELFQTMDGTLVIHACEKNIGAVLPKIQTLTSDGFVAIEDDRTLDPISYAMGGRSVRLSNRRINELIKKKERPQGACLS